MIDDKDCVAGGLVLDSERVKLAICGKAMTTKGANKSFVFYICLRIEI